MKSIQDCYTLNNGMKLPCIGFGTYQTINGDGKAIILDAIRTGYRFLMQHPSMRQNVHWALQLRKAACPEVNSSLRPSSGLMKWATIMPKKHWKHL